MGYISNVNFKVRGNNYSQEEKALNELLANFGLDRNYCRCHNNSFEREYFHSLDKKDFGEIKKISRKFQDVVIEMAVEGESRDDLWVARFKAGKMERIYAEIVWPDFEEIKLPDE